MPESFHCPNCGAPIALGGAPPPSVRCAHCGSTVIVPDRLRRRGEPQRVEIHVRAGAGTRAVMRALGRGVVLWIVAGVVITTAIGLAIGLAGLLLGIGASVASFALPGGVEAEARPELSFGGEGIGPGLFQDARHIGLDGEGRIVVGEYQGGRVQVFDPDGRFTTQWFADRDWPLTGMAVRRDGSVYTVQSGEIVLRDGSSGVVLERMAYAGGDHFEGLALLPDGGFVAGWYLNRDDLVVFGPEGRPTLTIPAAISGQTGEAELALRVAADGLGDLFVLGVFHGAVFRFDSSGRFLNRFGSEGSQPGQFQAPSGIAVDGQGRVFVGDIHGVQVFDRDGRYLGVIDPPGYAHGLTLDDEGRLWVVNGTQVMRFEVSLASPSSRGDPAGGGETTSK